MTSSEADRFMLDHPEVVVRAGPPFEMFRQLPRWVAWNRETDDPSTHGHTREGAIANYRDIYHPKKPKESVMTCLLADQRKYRKIIDEYKRYIDSPLYPYENMRSDCFGFTAKLWTIIKDDYPPHCNKCGQSLGAEKDST